MLNLLEGNWKGSLKVNGITYSSVSEAIQKLENHVGSIEVELNYSEAKEKPKTESKASKDIPLYCIEVKPYMTQPSSPGFDFMEKYNSNIPMPMRRMYGEVIGETKGMYKMRLHGRAERNQVKCVHCLRKLTNEVSRFYGIGPICGGHFHIKTPEIEEYLKDENKNFKIIDDKMRAIIWEGWIIKSAITLMEEVETVKRKAV